MNRLSKLSLLILPLYLLNLQTAHSALVRIITKNPKDEAYLMKATKFGGAMFVGRKVMALEFTDLQGKSKTIKIQTEDTAKEGIETLIDIRISKNERVVILSKTIHDPNNHDPYIARESTSTEITWLTNTGDELGKRYFNRTSSLKNISSDGRLTVVVDEGFDLESLKGDDEGDEDLLDHFLYILSNSGKTVLTRRIKGPCSAPDNTEFSPSGNWLVYNVGSKNSFINDLKTGTETQVALGTVGWKVTDNGELYAWEPEGKQGHWGVFNGEQAWFPDKIRKFRLHVKRPTQSEVIRTEQTDELAANEERALKEPKYNSNGLIELK